MYHVVKDEAGNTKIMTDKEYSDHQGFTVMMWIAGALLSVFGAIFFFLGKHLFEKGGAKLLGCGVLYLVGISLIAVGFLNGSFMSGMSPVFALVVVGVPSIFLWVLILKRPDLGLIVQSMVLVAVVKGLLAP